MNVRDHVSRMWGEHIKHCYYNITKLKIKQIKIHNGERIPSEEKKWSEGPGQYDPVVMNINRTLEIR